DSAGTATIDPNYEFQILKSVGRISGLAAQIATHPCRAGIGIGHTRWATHGPATVTNAHPHIGGEEQLVVVHNGVIENYADLKSRLQKKGYQFVSETDTEVIAHLVADCLKSKQQASAKGESHEIQTAVDAIKEAIAQLRGTYGLAIMFRQCRTLFSQLGLAVHWLWASATMSISSPVMRHPSSDTPTALSIWRIIKSPLSKLTRWRSRIAIAGL
ncbi:MAG: class II glutamine amidotransferase, partial [Planctomycetota bacterium]